jgi:hypothetical protein
MLRPLARFKQTDRKAANPDLSRLIEKAANQE